MSESIPCTILGGYLGAGKTTLLNHLLRHAGGRRLALIINDFGAINIDAALIGEQTEEQISLSNGCVCCSMSAGFDAALETLVRRRPAPDHIVVEASGVADVVSLAQYGHHPGLHPDGIVVVADAETVRAKAQDRYVAATVTRQLQGADLILLNKSDLVSSSDLDALQGWLAGLTGGTPVVTTRHCALPAAALLGIHTGTLPDPPLSSAAHPAYVTWHFRHASPLPRTGVDAFLDRIPATALRVKGFLALEPGGRHLLQRVGRRQTLAPTPGDGGTELVAIGLAGQFDPRELDAAAEVLTGRRKTRRDHG